MVFSLLVEKGLIKYEDKITKYWPEFGKKNKNDVTIRQLLMHRSGLCFFSKKITDKLLLDQEKLSEFLEDQELNWNVLSDRFGFDDHRLFILFLFLFLFYFYFVFILFLFIYLFNLFNLFLLIYLIYLFVLFIYFAIYF